jgi:hypothetical protein
MGQTESITLPCDHRYRTSQYFLQDQLHCSEAVADFRSVRDLLSGTSAFTTRTAFRFQPEAIRAGAD